MRRTAGSAEPVDPLPACSARLGEMVRSAAGAGNGGDATATPPPGEGDTEACATAASALARDPERIGPYRLIERLGEGGMGVVYLAEQTEPIRRRVALKVVRAGLTGEDARARFQSERRALALMDHPGIARIFDSGTTDGGQPWFAMEHVAGAPLFAYCEERSLPLADRLRLFAEICLAVQHAHQKGIVHRDLKPSNLLVVEVDGRPVPKVIDFGIAKAVDPSLSLDLALTQDGQILGTLAYMSPEQVSGDVDAVDTRSDVYALGVILYGLLAGKPPIEIEGRSLSEVIAAIGQADAPRLRSVRPDLDVDLEVIVGKTLERERERRYPSAAALAEDVRRFQADEPILARPPSTAYQLRKLARRHRAAVIGAALTAAAVIVGLTVSVVLWLRERDARREIDVLYESERDARQQVDALFASEQEARQQADALFASEREARQELDVQYEREREARQEIARSFGVTHEVVEFLGSLLGTSAGAGETGDTLTLASALERGELTLDRGRNRRSPESLGWIHAILGNAFLTLGDAEAAERNLEASLATPATSGAARIRALLDVGTIRARRGDAAGADAATAEALDMARAEPGPESLDLVRAFAVRCSVLRATGRFADARAAAEELLALTETLDAASADTVMHRSRALRMLGELELVAMRAGPARDYLERALAESESAGAEGTIEHAQVVGTLALAQAQLRDPDAIATSKRSIEETQAVYGRAHEETAAAWSNHATIVATVTGDFGAALDALRESIAVERAIGDEPRPSLGLHLANLAAWLLRGGLLDEAAQTAEEAVEILELTVGPVHQDLGMALSVFARVLAALGEKEGVVALHERALDMNRRTLGPDHFNTIMEASFLARAADAAGDRATAASAWRQAFESASAPQSPAADMRESFRAGLHAALLRAGDEASRAEATALEQRE